MTTVKAALLQTDWTGDQATMTDKHEEAAREAAGRSPGDVLPGAVLRPLLLSGAGRRVLQLHRTDPQRTDHEAVPERREGVGMAAVLPMYEVVQPGCTTTPRR